MSDAIASAPACATEQTDSPTAGHVAVAADVTDSEIDFLDRANETLHHSRAVLLVARDAIVGTDLPLVKLEGLMGTVQFLQDAMARLCEAAEKCPALHGDLYWPIHHASSLLRLLDGHESYAGFSFTFAPGVYDGFLGAVISCIERAQSASSALEDA